MSRKCANSPKLFCYICGEFTQKPQTKFITPTLKKAYELYFRCKIGDQGIAGHHIHVKIDVRDIYVAVSLALTHQSMYFAVPMAWREQKNHFTECYFCLTTIDSHNSKSKHPIAYPNIPSAVRPVEHDDSVPIPNPL
jgi:hypothetical protein